MILTININNSFNKRKEFIKSLIKVKIITSINLYIKQESLFP